MKFFGRVFGMEESMRNILALLGVIYCTNNVNCHANQPATTQSMTLTVSKVSETINMHCALLRLALKVSQITAEHCKYTFCHLRRFLMQIILTLWTQDYDGPQFILRGNNI